jgi:hypothetical protein
VWLTDFVGWLPMPDGGEHEAFLTADYNAEMIEHIARFPRLRDQAIFVGNDSDIVPDAFGPELPLIRDWTREHYSFAGYVTGFDPSDFADRTWLPAQATPDTIAEMITKEIGRQVDYRPVEHDGATRAAALIAEML